MSYKQRVMAFIWVLGGVFLAIGASYGLMVTPLVVELSSGKDAFSDIYLLNHDSKHDEYIQIKAQRLLHPGSTQQHWVPMQHNPFVFGLSTSRSHLVLAPNARQALRVISLKKVTDKERVYRLTIVPVFRQVEALTPRAHEVLYHVNLHVGYQVWVFVHPARIKRQIDIQQKGQALTIVNHGNISVLLHDGKQCDTHGLHCRALPERRLFAGNVWHVTLPYKTKPSFSY